jgi:hypothetical protein
MARKCYLPALNFKNKVSSKMYLERTFLQCILS